MVVSVFLDPLQNLGDLDGGVHALGGLEDGAQLALGGLEGGLYLGGLDEPGLERYVLLSDHVQDLDDLPDLDEKDTYIYCLNLQ